MKYGLLRFCRIQCYNTVWDIGSITSRCLGKKPALPRPPRCRPDTRERWKSSLYEIESHSVLQSITKIVSQSVRPSVSHLLTRSLAHWFSHSPSLSVRHSVSYAVGQTDSLSVCMFVCYSCLSDLGFKCLNFDFFFRVISTQVAGYVNTWPKKVLRRNVSPK